MPPYKHIRSDFTDPTVTGQNSSGLAAPFLQFIPQFTKSAGIEAITVHVDFVVEGVGSDFRFNVKSKSEFQLLDAANTVVSDVYAMYVKAIEDLRAFLDYKIGKDGVSTIGVPMPQMSDVNSDIFDFVKRLHGRS